MNEKKITGLDSLLEIFCREESYPSMSKTIPMRLEKAEKGRVFFYVRADERHLNSTGGVHGGFSATVIDTVTGSALRSELDTDIRIATVDLNVKMLSPIPIGDWLQALGTSIKITKSLGVSEGRIQDQNEKIYAYGTATFRVFRP